MLGLRMSFLPCMICILLVVVLVETSAAAETRVPTVASESVTIYLAEIQSAQPGEGCEFLHINKWGSCRTQLHARILRVFKGGDNLRSAPAEFDVKIQQNIRVSAAAPWGSTNIQSGQRYLIFSDAKEILPSSFASTLGPVPIIDQEDAIGDLELILNSEELTLHQQASAVAGAITTSGRTHSYFLANYAAVLLASGTEADTMVLARAVQDSIDRAFSDDAKVALLGHLWNGSKSAVSAPENLLKTYVIMTARYFLLPPNEPDPDVPDLREDILFRHIPWLVRSERAKALMRTALPPTLRQQFRKQALEVAADEGVRSEHRLLMKELLPLIGPN